MPLSEFQQEIARLLAGNRSLDSHVAGGSAIARDTIRKTGDIDIFNDREALVLEASKKDEQTLVQAGYTLRWIRDYPGIRSAALIGGPEALKLEWAHDAGWRFYPAQQDPDFSYLLHPADLATNKALTAASRKEPRDLFDLCALSDEIPIPAAILAAPAKDPGFTPDLIIEYIARFARYQQSDFDNIRASEPPQANLILPQIRLALEETRELAATIDPKHFGKLYLENGEIVTPDPQKIETSAYTCRTANFGGIHAVINDVPIDLIRKLYDKSGQGSW